MSRRRKRRGNGDEPLSDGDEQLELIAVPAHPVEAEADTAKRCTGQLLFERYPQDYADIVNALAAKMPIRRIKKLWAVGTGTVYAVQRREGAKVGTLKANIASSLLMGVNAGAERFAELITECDDVVAVSMALKAMAETANLMAGQATSITEHRVISVNANALASDLAALVSKMDSEAAEKFPLARDVTASPAPRPELTQTALDLASIPLPVDKESNADGIHGADNQRIAAPCHTSCHGSGVKPSNFDQGGGGDGARGAASTSQ